MLTGTSLAALVLSRPVTQPKLAPLVHPPTHKDDLRRCPSRTITCAGLTYLPAGQTYLPAGRPPG
eukprot:356261-Chlamydomonas_euryale.AAC.4